MRVDLTRFRPSPAVTRLVAAAVGTLLLFFAGLRARRAGDERRAQLRAAETTLATFADWRRRFQPAVAAESISWQRAWMEVRDLGVVGDERVGLMQHVARSAEFAGLRDVRVLVAPPDSSGSEARLSTSTVRRHPAPFGLVVESRGSLQSVVSFLGGLPPSVAVTGLRLVRQNGSGRHRLTLAVYELEFDDIPSPAARPSVERRAAAGGGRDRAGS